MHEVKIMRKKSGEITVLHFDSYYLCEKYVRKINRSKKYIVLTHPNFIEL